MRCADGFPLKVGSCEGRCSKEGGNSDPKRGQDRLHGVFGGNQGRNREKVKGERLRETGGKSWEKWKG